MSPSKPKILPPEIIEEILSRLPPKSLGRCKSVSKTWHSLIIPYLKTTKLLLTSYAGSLYTLDINSLLDFDLSSPTAKSINIELTRIWGSCHGLVLAEDENKLFLMNPTTKELWKVPRNPFVAHLAHINGFGYDQSTDDYKIVSITNERSIPASWSGMLVSVYSLRGNSWRKLPNAPKLYDYIISSNSFLVNHKLYTLVRTPSRFLTIMAFSLENEEFNEIQVPDSIKNATDMCYDLVVFRGKLAIFTCYYSGLDLWVMEEYGMPKSWTKVCCLHGEGGRSVRPVCLVERSDRDIILRDFHDDGSVLVYNIDARRYRKVQIDGLTRFSVQGTYAETLESPAKYIRIAPIADSCGMWGAME